MFRLRRKLLVQVDAQKPLLSAIMPRGVPDFCEETQGAFDALPALSSRFIGSVDQIGLEKHRRP
jgi:hypothetical protein